MTPAFPARPASQDGTLRAETLPARHSAPIYLSIGADGQLTILIAGEAPKPTTLATLASDLTTVAGDNATMRRILIRAATEVTYPTFQRVVDALNAGGFYEVALIGSDQAVAPSPQR